MDGSFKDVLVIVLKVSEKVLIFWDFINMVNDNNICYRVFFV